MIGTGPEYPCSHGTRAPRGTGKDWKCAVIGLGEVKSNDYGNPRTVVIVRRREDVMSDFGDSEEGYRKPRAYTKKATCRIITKKILTAMRDDSRNDNEAI
jgi:hypothetical protein